MAQDHTLPSQRHGGMAMPVEGMAPTPTKGANMGFELADDDFADAEAEMGDIGNRSETTGKLCKARRVPPPAPPGSCTGGRSHGVLGYNNQTRPTSEVSERVRILSGSECSVPNVPPPPAGGWCAVCLNAHGQGLGSTNRGRARQSGGWRFGCLPAPLPLLLGDDG